MNIIIKTFFDASNLIRRKLWDEYDGNSSFSKYAISKAGNKKIVELVNRYFIAINANVNVEYVELDLLGKIELTIKLSEVGDDDLNIIMSSPIVFY